MYDISYLIRYIKLVNLKHFVNVLTEKEPAPVIVIPDSEEEDTPENTGSVNKSKHKCFY